MRKKSYKEGEIYLSDVMRLLKSLPDDSVDLVFGSPPYEDRRTYAEVEFNLKGQDWVDWMVRIYRESIRVCTGLVAYVVGTGKTDKFRWSATPGLLIADLHRSGIILRDPKWYKRNGIPGSGGPDDMRKDLEFIICACKYAKKLPWSDNTACGKPPKYPPGGNMTHRNEKGERRMTKKQTSGYKDGDTVYEKKDRKFTEIANPGTVINCGAVGGGHLGSNISHENEAPFPEKLADFFIRSYCPPGGTVLDPFGGSGTTAACAIKTGRKFITGDVRESQVKLIQRRIKQARLKKGFGL